ncbi:F0F1 ATP synthase subunit gamma [Usitatibacter palustris]|uniref:ATP synthase gamma chain n=1 Tax=Usitatibacter palustris TaxID=2732487 RepID=A0A6M4HB92_9PROT|nr:F0F1 ATP synthase subunit gamma [Usitatibacter palustris]QJR16960.1 ATP synthase gamma chain [Usitatibacter palustris]
MAGSKEIRTKIKSVQNTRKITKAMEMVAASKMRKAQERMRHARPYGDKIRNIAAHLAHANPEYRHPFLIDRPDASKDVGVLLVTSDKGLCGGLNTNALRLVTNKTKELQDAGRKVKFTAMGNKGFSFLQRFGGEIVSHVVGLGDRPHLEQLIGPVRVQINLYNEGKIGALYIVYTRFINTMKQEPVVEQLLPLPSERLSQDSRAIRKNWDYVYEPDAKVVLDQLLRRYLEAIIFQALSENIASEQSARMVAMKSASDNASSVIDDLTLVYNKSRQAAITKELSEIVGGAAAV